MLRLYRFVRILAIGLCLAVITLPVRAAGPKPPWHRSEHPRRAVFRVPPHSGSTALLALPESALPLSSPLDAARASKVPVVDPVAADGSSLPFRILRADPWNTHLLVGLSNQAAPQRVVFYFGGTAAVRRATAPVTDPTPIQATVYPLTGKGIPNAWEKMQYLHSLSPRPAKSLRLSMTNAAPVISPRAAKAKPTERWIVRTRSAVAFPTTGVYRITVQTPLSAYVFLDGEPVAQRDDPHVAPGSQSGPPVHIEAGTHLLETYAASGPTLDLHLRWLLPGTTRAVPIPSAAFVSATWLDDFRLEQINKPIQPAFRYKPARAYVFRSHPEVFVPVQFRNTTHHWLPGARQALWRFGDGADSIAAGPLHVYTAAARHRPELVIRDTHGFVASVRHTIDARPAIADQYAAAFHLVEVPSVAYPQDKIMAAVTAFGTAPAKHNAFKVEITFHPAEGPPTHHVREIAVSKKGTRVPLPAQRAGDLARIEWRVLHQNVTLAGGTTLFLRPPFDPLPVRAVGDRLLDAEGRQLVLVPHHGAGHVRQAPLATRAAPRRIVWIDDCLLPPGSRVGAQSCDRVLARQLGVDRHAIALKRLAVERAAAPSAGPLEKFVRVRELVGPDTDLVVLSIGLMDMLEMRDIARIERHAAAMTDLITTSIKLPVVWLTPPPFPSGLESVRPCAAAVRRVADARAVPVADLYTAFSCLPPRERLFTRTQDLALAPRGHRLVAQIVARALSGRSRE